MHRNAGALPFSRDEQRWIQQFGPHLAAGSRQSLLLERMRRPGKATAGVLVVSDRGETVSVSSQGEAWPAELAGARPPDR